MILVTVPVQFSTPRRLLKLAVKIRHIRSLHIRSGPNIVNMVTLIYCPCNNNSGLVRIRTMPDRDITQFIG